MSIEERQGSVDEVVGMIEDYLYEKDIDMSSEDAQEIVERAASGWLAEYVAYPVRDAEKRFNLCQEIGESVRTLTWAESCLIDERRTK